MDTKKTVDNNQNSEIQSILKSAKDFLKRNKFKNTETLLLKVFQHDINNKEAKELMCQVEKGRRIFNFRITLICIFLITVTITAILGWTELHSTDVSIQLSVTQLRFTLEKDWNIFSVKAKSVGISHLDKLELFPEKVEMAIEYSPKTDKPSKWLSNDVQNSFQIEPVSEYWNVLFQSDYLNLSSMVVDSGSIVEMSIDEQNENKLSISILKGRVSGTVETDTIFILKCNQCQTGKYFSNKMSLFNIFKIFTKNREINFQDLNNSINIILEFPVKQLNKDLYAFGKSIAVREIGFIKDEGGEIESTIIEEGKICFAELDEKEYNLKIGEFLRIKGLENFQIKRLFLNKQLVISLKGKVRDVKSGTLLYSRMPTYLEWLHANNSIAIFLGTLIPVFSVIIAILLRLKIFNDL